MPPARQSRLEASARDQAFICEQWKLIQSSMTIDKALHAFLTQKIDDCGQTIAFEAFRLVQQVLNPKGFVRKAHTGPETSLGTVLSDAENAWSQGGLRTDRQWDWMGSWHKQRKLWKTLDNTQELKLEMVKNFCEPAAEIEEGLQRLPREQQAIYKDGQRFDRQFKMPAVSASGKRLEMRTSMPDDLQEPVLRWETFCGTDEQIAKKIDNVKLEESIKKDLEKFEKCIPRMVVSKLPTGTTRDVKKALAENIILQIDPFKTTFNTGVGEFMTKANTFRLRLIKIAIVNMAGANNNLLTQAQKDALRNRVTREITVLENVFDAPGGDFMTKANIYRTELLRIADREKVKLDDKNTKLNVVINDEVADLVKDVRNLEPYWKFTMRSDDWAKGKQKDEDETDVLEKTMDANDIPDLNDPATYVRHTVERDLRPMFHKLGLKFPAGKKKSELRDILMDIKNGVPYEPDGGQNPTVARYKNNVTHKYVGLLDRPDLVIEVGYLNEKTGLFRKRVVIVEVDGHDKTATGDDAAKLALKLMSSSSAQIPVNDGDTFHIRSNFSAYASRPIEQSLMQTTDISLPEFADMVRAYQNTPKTRQNDYRNFHHAIHLMHYMFTAHVKIAFVIHMLAMHDIDMLSLDADGARVRESGARESGAREPSAPDPRMRNYCFFVNVQAHHVPEKLCFETDIPTHRKEWMERHLMLHSRPQIKHWDAAKQKSAWAHAPLMHASTPRARMRTWTAAVRKGPLPPFPYEPPSAVPVTCVRIQRVNMKELIACVEAAAGKAVEAYNKARKLEMRSTWSTDQSQIPIFRRLFPDRFFLTRKQQYDRDAAWNKVRDANSFVLRERSATADDDMQEHNWGYESPNITRNIEIETPDGSQFRRMPARTMKWDQIDVRMHLFHQEMKKVEGQWRAHASGMWYLQDYIDFFNMIRSLSVPIVNLVDSDLHFTYVPAASSEEVKWARAQYAFQGRINPPPPGGAAQYHLYYFNTPTYDDNGTPRRMPMPTPASDAAHHRFSVLSYLFDCRDDGACRYEWESEMLKYFGSEANDKHHTEFDKFHFKSAADWARENQGGECGYFNQLWFQMTFFLELNFRNAIAQLHYKMFDLKFSSSDRVERLRDLQENARMLYNRQRSLLNTRARCPGPSKVTPGLSFWQKQSGGQNKNNVLKHLILSQLNDELPDLDPYLMAYVARENIPDAQLFLRMIGCPNIIALRELAVQHRYLLGEESPPPGASQRPLLQNTLRHFPDGVQTEILYLLKKVQTDDSIFCVTPAVHPSKRVLLTLPWFTKMVRRALDVHARVMSFATPLQMKFYMFTRESEFVAFRQLFCTADTLEHAYASRPLVFVLLQISLALSIMRGDVQGPQGLQGRCNEALKLLLERMQINHENDIQNIRTNVRYTFGITDASGQPQNVPCTLGTSLYTWPVRDRNQINVIRKNQGAVSVIQNADVFGLNFNPNLTAPYPDGLQLDVRQLSMKTTEQHKWILLMYARPTGGGVCEFLDVQHDDGLTVRQPSEKPCRWRRHPDRHRDTMIIGVRDINEGRCELHDVPDSDIFFEKVMPPPDSKFTECAIPFPPYILDIIPSVPDRTLIYVPAVFASRLRQDAAPIHDALFSYDNCYWRMSCVGYRAWAWKRLLVKCVFFDAWTKVMTRSMSLLALHMPVEPFYCEDGNNSQQRTEILRTGFQSIFQKLKKMMTATNSALGDMQFKREKLGPLDATQDNKLRRKTLQIRLTVHKKKWKETRIDDQEIMYTKSKVSLLQMQVLWVTYMQNHMADLETQQTTRFLKVHARLWKSMKQSLNHEADPVSLAADAVLVYGNYLHSITQRTDIAVQFQNNVYVKFPKEYAVLMDTTGTPRAGLLQSTEIDSYFATLFDCRTYSVSHPNVLRKAYSRQDRVVLQNLGGTVALEGVDSVNKWHPAEDDRDDVWAFLAKDISALNPPSNIDWRLIYEWPPRPFIDDGLMDDTKRRNVYTLPDLYTAQADKVAACRAVRKDGAGLLLKEDFLDKVERANDDDKLFLWNELRASTHFIQTAQADPATGTGIQVLRDTECIGDADLKARVDAIQTQLLPKTNEDA